MSGLGENPDLVYKVHQYTSPFTSSGAPTITMQGGQTEEGLTIGFQFAAAHFREDLLVRAGVAWQARPDWHRRHRAL